MNSPEPDVTEQQYLIQLRATTDRVGQVRVLPQMRNRWSEVGDGTFTDLEKAEQRLASLRNQSTCLEYRLVTRTVTRTPWEPVAAATEPLAANG